MRNIILILSIVISISSCLPSGSSNKEEAAKQKKGKIGELVANKAEIEKYYFQIKGQDISVAEVPYGEEIILYLEGLEGFKEEQGKIACDGSMHIFNSKNEEIVKMEDLYKESYPKGVPIEMASNKLSLSMKCRPPFEMNEKYKIVYKVKDKKSEAKIEITETFLITPAKGLTYKEDGLTSSGVYFFKNDLEEGVIADQKISAGDTVYAYIPGVMGAFEENGKVYPDASITLTNEFGDVLAEFKDMYGDYTKTGFSAEDFKALNVFHMVTPTDLVVGKKYTMTFKLGDKKAKEKTLEAKYEVIVK
ncbi:MAG: hypothetical protein IPG89_21445 [Bacteroidetes bacterium]|nr:hypothetical protein [Bacteroidota bacterium]